MAIDPEAIGIAGFAFVLYGAAGPVFAGAILIVYAALIHLLNESIYKQAKHTNREN